MTQMQPHSQAEVPPCPSVSVASDITLTRYTSLDDVPFDDANALLLEHATLMHARMVADGGPDFDIAPHVKAFWAKFEQCLPPHGSFYLAWGPDGALLGTGSLRTVAPGVGEMKHLYVRLAARGMGLGRRLIDARIADARAMGMTTLLADTFAANPEMPALYDRIGFERTGPSGLSGTAAISPALTERMLFFRMVL